MKKRNESWIMKISLTKCTKIQRSVTLNQAISKLFKRSHMRPAFVLGFYLAGAMIKGNNCSICGQMTVFSGEFQVFFFAHVHVGVILKMNDRRCRYGSIFKRFVSLYKYKKPSYNMNWHPILLDSISCYLTNGCSSPFKQGFYI